MHLRMPKNAYRKGFTAGWFFYFFIIFIIVFIFLFVFAAVYGFATFRETQQQQQLLLELGIPFCSRSRISG